MEPHCPRCGQDIVQRVRRRGLLDHLLSIVYIYPFRCQVCFHRFSTSGESATSNMRVRKASMIAS